MDGEIYLDHNGSGPLSEAAKRAMRPWINEGFGSSAASHGFGERAMAAIDEARSSVAELIGAKPSEIFFTGGGTESNNMAVKGTAWCFEGGHILISATEHGCVAGATEWLSKRGYSYSLVGVDRSGQIDPEEVRRKIRPNTRLVAIMHSNNETGAILPIAQVGQICADKSIPLLSDAVQSVGKAPVDVHDLGVSFLSIGAHKLNGPKGVGALYIRERCKLEPLVHGSGHEQGIRSGTQDTAGIVGMGAAAKRYLEEGDGIREKYQKLRDRLEERLLDEIPDVSINAAESQRLVNTCSAIIAGVTSTELLEALRGRVAASAGATCHTSDPKPSKVLSAMGLTVKECASTIRLSVGYGTTEKQIETAADLIVTEVKKLRG